MSIDISTVIAGYQIFSCDITKSNTPFEDKFGGKQHELRLTFEKSKIRLQQGTPRALVQRVTVDVKLNSNVFNLIRVS